MPRKKPEKPTEPVGQIPPPTPPTAPVMAADDPNPGACCPNCGCRHAPVQFTQRTGKRTIRTRRCRNCGTRFREIAISVELK